MRVVDNEKLVVAGTFPLVDVAAWNYGSQHKPLVESVAVDAVENIVALCKVLSRPEELARAAVWVQPVVENVLCNAVLTIAVIAKQTVRQGSIGQRLEPVAELDDDGAVALEKGINLNGVERAVHVCRLVTVRNLLPCQVCELFGASHEIDNVKVHGKVDAHGLVDILQRLASVKSTVFVGNQLLEQLNQLLRRRLAGVDVCGRWQNSENHVN